MRPNIDEAMRYLGVHSDPDGTVRQQLETLGSELYARITPHHIWVTLPVDHTDGLRIGSIPLPGKSAATMLADCDRCALLLCTLGANFDLWLRRIQARDMSQAVMMDALGSSYVEAICDAATEEIARRFPNKHLTDRFSPGYGDLPLSVQPALLEAVGAMRLGVSLTRWQMMIPCKSVSALIGLADVPQMARIRGCAHCSMNQTCTLRKAGKSCGI